MKKYELIESYFQSNQSFPITKPLWYLCDRYHVLCDASNALSTPNANALETPHKIKGYMDFGFISTNNHNALSSHHPLFAMANDKTSAIALCDTTELKGGDLWSKC